MKTYKITVCDLKEMLNDPVGTERKDFELKGLTESDALEIRRILNEYGESRNHYFSIKPEDND